MTLSRFFLASFLMLISLPAQSEVKVIALFADKAMVEIDGERKIVSKGQSFKGITLISATGRGAVLQFKEGRRQTLGLNQTGIQSSYKRPQKKTLRVYSDDHGMFQLAGKVNNRSTQFLIDTGATYVSMSESEAKRLGVDYQQGRKTMIQTANAVVRAWRIDLDTVKVGQIELRNVDAVVLPGKQPSTALLGMSFLQHLKLQRDGAAMIIEQKY